jgi:RNA polymerase primary sigma factor
MKYSTSLIIRTDNVQRYFKDINNPKYSPLSDIVIRRLFADRNKNRERIINANIRLVATIAKTYDKGDNFMDFNQEGIEGLMIAVDRYNPNADAKFSSYAANWIRAKMSMLCRELNMVQRSNQGKIGSKAIKFQEQFFKENMREATTEEIIEHLSENCGIDVLYANEVFGVSVNSINAELNDDDFTPETCGEFAVKTSCLNDYDKQIEQEDLEDAISKMMRILTDKEREFITRHIYNEETYETIAETSGLTNERVRQIVMGGLKKMKDCEFAKKKFACYLK